MNVIQKDTEGRIPLHLASDIDIIEFYVVDCGVNINFPDDEYESLLFKLIKKRKRKTIIDVYAKFGQSIDLSIQTKRRFSSVLHQSVETNHFSIFKFLVEKGSPIELQNKYGYTILHLSVLKSRIPFIEYLITRFNTQDDLKQQQFFNQKDKFGNTPIFLSLESNNPKVFEILLNSCPYIDKNIKNSRNESLISNICFRLRKEFVEIFNTNKCKNYQLLKLLLNKSKNNQTKSTDIELNDSCVSSLLFIDEIRNFYIASQFIREQTIKQNQVTKDHQSRIIKDKHELIEKLKQRNHRKGEKVKELTEYILDLSDSFQKEKIEAQNEHEMKINEMKVENGKLEALKNENNTTLINEIEKLKIEKDKIQQESDEKCEKMKDSIKKLRNELFEERKRIQKIKEEHELEIKKRNKVIKKYIYKEETFNTKLKRAKEFLQVL